jgi:NAD(P)-dependent dehydrogenase (short-subunit alcohol dehydrogenase family)
VAVVLVTGGSSGIGLATVGRLAAAGHRVYAASRVPTRNPVPAGVVPLVLDVGSSDPGAAADAVRSVVDDAGRLDVLVNNAGTGTLGALEETGDDEAHRIFEVNVFGPMRLAAAVVPVMREQGGGRIVNVTSLNDVLPAPFGGWYSASKAALASLSAVLDAEVRSSGISVTVVAPGFFRTEMAESTAAVEAPAGSRYAGALARLRSANLARLDSAGDPDTVATAIERVIEAADAPARVVVGADAESMTRLVDESDAETLARLLRAFVSELESG